MADSLIQNTQQFVRETLRFAEGGHDWQHILRVWKLAKHIAEKEGSVEMQIVELGALLHDIADSKFNDGDETIGPKKAADFLKEQQVDKRIIDHIKNIVAHISFKGGNHKQTFFSSELAVIQDADRLDAIGAIGVARAFNYGGFKNRSLYDPQIQPQLHMTKEAYKKNKAPTINHFYEKLLLIKDRMNTETGRQLAEERHLYMLQFLEQFYKEWYVKL